MDEVHYVGGIIYKILSVSLVVIVIVVITMSISGCCNCIGDGRIPQSNPTNQARSVSSRQQIRQNRRQISGTIVEYKINERAGDGNDGCTICLEEFNDGEQCRVLDGCHHIYHKSCIDGWLIKDRHCPLCRFSVRGTRTDRNPDTVPDQLNQV
ncbi:E3 ubiquitin-protein ligase RING1-like [Tripterygium wilfordii]|uniref:E3 ubiquitin-protein ligase RING1-like n=1 Tax=Tripterygium wilfordii TaxID=458696 RepID=UPI0018F81F9C|nr:E3 ubiquitin-protein ligase RING1-like [Tripterygium wilfordii]